MVDVETVCRWAGVVVAGAGPVYVAIRLRDLLMMDEEESGGRARRPQGQTCVLDQGKCAWIRWHNPIVCLTVTESLAHLSFITTGHRGECRTGDHD